MQTGSKSEFLQALMLSMVFIFITMVSTPLVSKNDGLDSDGRYYAAMAGVPDLPEEFTKHTPFCYRVLGPTIAAVMPFEPLINFRIMGMVFSLITLLLVYYVARAYKLSHYLALVATGLWAASFWALRFSWFSPFYVDYITSALALGIWLAAKRDAWIVMVILFVLAALQKTSLAFMLPVSLLILASSELDVKKKWIIAGASFVAFAIPVVLTRIFIEPVDEYVATNLWNHNLHRMKSDGYGIKFLMAIYSGTGILFFLMVGYGRSTWRSLMKHKELLVSFCVTIPMLMGGADKARLFLYFLPFAVITSVLVIDRIGKGQDFIRIAIATGAVFIAQVYLSGWWIDMNDFQQYKAVLVPIHGRTDPTDLLVYGIVTVVVLSACYFLLRKKNQTASPHTPSP